MDQQQQHHHHHHHDESECHVCSQHGTQEQEITIQFAEDTLQSELHALEHYLDAVRQESVIAKVDQYQPLHPEIFQLQDEFLDDSFKAAVHLCRNELIPLLDSGNGSVDGSGNGEAESTERFVHRRREVLSELLTPVHRDVYIIPLFTPSFCEMLLEEVEHFERSVNADILVRPNTMNRSGVVLEQLGMKQVFDALLRDWMAPLAKVMNRGRLTLDDQHAFIVEYEATGSKDKHLNMHFDDSELTINLCLGKEFQGGEVMFAGHRDRPDTHGQLFVYDQVVGQAILHDGKHMHSALPIREGERVNLILWMRSSEYRRQRVQTLRQLIQSQQEEVEQDLSQNNIRKNQEND